MHSNMCGVLAYAGKGKINARQCLAHMEHRGPDHEGLLEEGSVTLGHRRLAIIDVSAGGNQPMRSVSGNTAITFNGEIYNYKALRDELAREGARFATQSDTEVILEGYERHGEAFFENLRGMWTFVLYDRARNRLIATRDPFGIKPLVYAIHAGSVYFASEIRCLAGLIPLEPDPAGYPAFYNLGYFIAPATPYRGVKRLTPGEVLGWDIGTGTLSQLSRVSRHAPGVREFQPGGDPTDFLDKALTASIEAHYVADVPVSLLLSGGNDSSLIAALSKKLGKQPTAYHVAIAGSEDTEYATAIAKHLELDLVIEPLSEAALAKQYEKIWDVIDEPTGDLSIIPTSLIYERIHGRSKVVLSGEGGDELFGGYLRHAALARHQRVAKSNVLNSTLNSLLGTSAGALKAWNPVIQRLRHAALKSGATNDLVGAYLKGVRLMDYPLYDQEVRSLLANLYKADYDERMAPVLALDTIAYLPNDLLPKGDITSMASSIEARVPYVDRMLAAEVSSVSEVLGAPRGDKRPLREVLARYLPRELVFRSKKGFGVPMRSYDSRAFLEDFHKAGQFHLAHQADFAVNESLARLLGSASSRSAIAQKFPSFAFALISNWKRFAV